VAHCCMWTSASIEHIPLEMLTRWRGLAMARSRQRWSSPRKRRTLAASVRWAAGCSRPSSRYSVLLDDRIARVRGELFELARMLEEADDPDPGWVRAIHALMTDGCESPLLNPAVHISELWAELYYLRGGRCVGQGEGKAYRASEVAGS
jgi:hypothetical protein